MSFKDLFKKPWEQSNPQKRLAGIEKLNDQEVLKKIAFTDQYVDIRVAAIKKIKDEPFLMQYALALDAADCPSLLKEMIRDLCYMIHSPNNLVALIQGLKSERHIDACMRTLIRSEFNNQEQFLAIYNNTSSQYAREEAAVRIEDPDVLAKIVQKIKDENKRFRITGKLTDRKVLQLLALKDTSHPVREEAIKQLDKRYPTESKEVFITAFFDEKNYNSIRNITIKHISDQKQLLEIATGKMDYAIRLAALQKITDQAVLEKLVFHNDRFWGDAFALLPYSDQRILAAVGQIGKSARADRMQGAKELLSLLQQNQQAAHLLWNYMKKMVEVPHSDISNHVDDGVKGRSNDCTHSDFQRHTDTGTGILFPPYPV
ncbi:HEAT repeat domain-containing protein [Parabacteroides sp. PF5-9]|uniref:HEAT repeat domain-containing protein n=1 Tax=Parabacteroides sp. PF5-9 TaxID=1742404 RepID=UPI002476DE06|nr:HEAT repeat domain-containing protein [Parabacteroides sp. PF5-9]MDH6356405.1 hypothetical protein [Parabacteroides sp. PF5-9]